jgi:hypothetical protein
MECLRQTTDTTSLLIKEASKTWFILTRGTWEGAVAAAPLEVAAEVEGSGF